MRRATSNGRPYRDGNSALSGIEVRSCVRAARNLSRVLLLTGFPSRIASTVCWLSFVILINRRNPRFAIASRKSWSAVTSLLGSRYSSTFESSISISSPSSQRRSVSLPTGTISPATIDARLSNPCVSATHGLPSGAKDFDSGRHKYSRSMIRRDSARTLVLFLGGRHCQLIALPIVMIMPVRLLHFVRSFVNGTMNLKFERSHSAGRQHDKRNRISDRPVPFQLDCWPVTRIAAGREPCGSL